MAKGAMKAKKEARKPKKDAKKPRTFRIVAVSHVGASEHCARLIFAAQVPAGERYARKHAQILLDAGRKHPLFRLAVEPVIYDLNHAGIDLRGRSRRRHALHGRRAALVRG